MRSGFPVTLELDGKATQAARDAAEQGIETATIDYRVGDRLAAARVPLTSHDVEQRLRAEHKTLTGALSFGSQIRPQPRAFRNVRRDVCSVRLVSLLS